MKDDDKVFDRLMVGFIAVWLIALGIGAGVIGVIIWAIIKLVNANS